MKNLVFVSVIIMLALNLSAQNAVDPKSTGKPGLLKLKPGEVISFDKNNNAPAKTQPLNDAAVNSSIPRAEDFYNKDFQEYTKTAAEEISQNDQTITELKNILAHKDQKAVKKELKKVSSLEIENHELQTDFDNYLKYGMGNWKEFKMEFNYDLIVVVKDLKALEQKYLGEDATSLN